MLTSGKVSHFPLKVFPCPPYHTFWYTNCTAWPRHCFTLAVNSVWTAVQEQSRGLLSSGPAYTKELQSRGSSETGDFVLCMPDSVKENNKPGKKEGSKSMADLQVIYVMTACCAYSRCVSRAFSF